MLDLFAPKEWQIGHKILTFQPMFLIHQNRCLANGSNVHKCRNKKEKNKYLRYLKRFLIIVFFCFLFILEFLSFSQSKKERKQTFGKLLIIDAFVTFCFPPHLWVLLDGSVFLTVSCYFRCGAPQWAEWACLPSCYHWRLARPIPPPSGFFSYGPD